jgi:hypothetical protein
VGYAPGEERRQSQQPAVTISASATFTSQATPPAPPRQIESAKVFDLADWRARRRTTEQQSPSSSPPAQGESSGAAPRTPPRTSIGASEHGNGHADGQDHHQ